MQRAERGSHRLSFSEISTDLSHVDKVYYPDRKVGSDKRSLGGRIQILGRFRVSSLVELSQAF